MQVAMNYDEWLKTVPATLSEDVLWKVEAYRLALFLSDMCWSDVIKLAQDKRTLDLSDQQSSPKLWRYACARSSHLFHGAGW